MYLKEKKWQKIVNFFFMKSTPQRTCVLYSWLLVGQLYLVLTFPSFWLNPFLLIPRKPESFGPEELSKSNLTIELALFVDPSSYAIFSEVVSSHQELVDTIMATINQVQALYRLPSLGQTLQLTIATLEIQLRTPLTLQTFGGQQYQFLESFCNYQHSLNNPDDKAQGGNNTQDKA